MKTSAGVFSFLTKHVCFDKLWFSVPSRMDGFFNVVKESICTFSNVANASTKDFSRFPRCSVSFPEVREASRGADLDLGILEVAHQRPREFPRCNDIFRIRRGGEGWALLLQKAFDR